MTIVQEINSRTQFLSPYAINAISPLKDLYDMIYMLDSILHIQHINSEWIITIMIVAIYFPYLINI